MKKMTITAILFAAAIVLSGCANDSDTSNTKKSDSGFKLPESKGENELVGKTFSNGWAYVIFTDKTIEIGYQEQEDDYVDDNSSLYDYTIDGNEKKIYIKQSPETYLHKDKGQNKTYTLEDYFSNINASESFKKAYTEHLNNQYEIVSYDFDKTTGEIIFTPIFDGDWHCINQFLGTCRLSKNVACECYDYCQNGIVYTENGLFFLPAEKSSNDCYKDITFFDKNFQPKFKLWFEFESNADKTGYNFDALENNEEELEYFSLFIDIDDSGKFVLQP